jgi:hypothetical protein
MVIAAQNIDSFEDQPTGWILTGLRIHLEDPGDEGNGAKYRTQKVAVVPEHIVALDQMLKFSCFVLGSGWKGRRKNVFWKDFDRFAFPPCGNHLIIQSLSVFDKWFVSKKALWA